MAAFDTVIIGAGSAGCVLAARLSEDAARTVLLVEAGGPARDPAIADPAAWLDLPGRAIDWGFVTTPQPGTAGRAHAWPRGRVLGGTSCLHAMAHVRGHPGDFDAWAAAGCAGWGYADLLAYFIRSENSAFGPSPHHGADGPLRLLTPHAPHPVTRAFMAAAEEQGYAPIPEHNGARMCGPTLNTLNVLEGRRQSVADAYLTPALARPNLTVLDRSLVTSLAFHGRRCTGVTLVRDGQAETQMAGEGVILAAGAIGSPHILMLAGIGPARDLAAQGIGVRVDLPAVGRNLQDHLLAAGNLYRARRPLPRSRYQHSESLLYVGEGGNPDAPPALALACVVLPVVSDALKAPPAGAAYTILSGFTRPASRGSIRLAGADPRLAPVIDPNYLAAPADRAALALSLALAREIGHARAFDAWREEELLPGPRVTKAGEIDAFLARAAITHHHPVGTCAMGSVVSPEDLSVRGVEGLHVVDASVMPRITSGPPNAAIVAIAERASDLLRGRPPLPPARLN